MRRPVNADRLRQAVNEAKVQQTKLAEALGISKQLFTHWLQGRRQPSDPQLKKLAAAVGVDVSFLTAANEGVGAAQQSHDSLASALWDFRDAPPDGGRDYGNANALAFTPDIDTLVRELGQNALDQLLRSAGSMHLRFSLIELTDGSPAYDAFINAMKWSDLRPHIEAAIALNSRLSAKLRRGLASGRLRLLRIDDFGTTGAYGGETTSNERGARSPFAALMRDNLNSSKETNVAGGTHGAGKGTAWQCSDVSTVLLSSRIAPSYIVDGQPADAYRFIGKTELTWHNWADAEGGPKAGPGWLAHSDSTKSLWLSGRELAPLFLDRDQSTLPAEIDPSAASGTSILIVGFRDPQDDGDGDPTAITNRIQRAVAENFFPAMLEERMAVSVEHVVDGVVRHTELVDAAKYVPEMAAAYTAHREDQLVPHERAGAGDTTHASITHPVPATRRDASPTLTQFDDLEATADLVVRFAKSEELGPSGTQRRQLVNHVALVRGRLMVVEYMRRSNLVVGGRPFHGILLAGEAPGDGLAQSAAEQFFRLAEPPAHNKWIWREDVRDNYRLGAKQELSHFYQALNDELRELIKPEEEGEDDGPEELRKLLFLAGSSRSTAAAVIRVANQQLKDGKWVITADVSINERKRSLVLTPTLSVQPESGTTVDLEWERLDVVRAVRGTALKTAAFEIAVAAGTSKVTFSATSKGRGDDLDLSRCRVVARVATRASSPSTEETTLVAEEAS